MPKSSLDKVRDLVVIAAKAQNSYERAMHFMRQKELELKNVLDKLSEEEQDRLDGTTFSFELKPSGEDLLVIATIEKTGVIDNYGWHLRHEIKKGVIA